MNCWKRLLKRQRKHPPHVQRRGKGNARDTPIVSLVSENPCTLHLVCAIMCLVRLGKFVRFNFFFFNKILKKINKIGEQASVYLLHLSTISKGKYMIMILIIFIAFEVEFKNDTVQRQIKNVLFQLLHLICTFYYIVSLYSSCSHSFTFYKQFKQKKKKKNR